MSNRQSEPSRIGSLMPGMTQHRTPTLPQGGNYEYGYDDTMDGYPSVEAVELPKPKAQRSETQKSVFQENFGQYDRIGSYYMWVIYYPKRGQEQRKDHGYTKPRNQPEPRDKTEMLKRAINRVCKKYADRYLRPGMRIEYFRCLTDYNDDNVHLFTMHPDRVVGEDVMIHAPEMMDWLYSFYDSPVTTYGTELFPKAPVDAPTMPPRQAPMPDVTRQGPPKDPFAEDRHFTDHAALYSYTQKLIRDGQPVGRAEHYYRVMAAKVLERNKSAQR